MSDDTIEPFSFPAVGRKKVTAAFDGGRFTSDSGVMLLAAAERRLGIANRLAALISDPRDPNLVTRSVADLLRARILAIARGYEDADDLLSGISGDAQHRLASAPCASHCQNRTGQPRVEPGRDDFGPQTGA